MGFIKDTLPLAGGLLGAPLISRIIGGKDKNKDRGDRTLMNEDFGAVRPRPLRPHIY